MCLGLSGLPQWMHLRSGRRKETHRAMRDLLQARMPRSWGHPTVQVKVLPVVPRPKTSEIPESMVCRILMFIYVAPKPKIIKTREQTSHHLHLNPGNLRPELSNNTANQAKSQTCCSAHAACMYRVASGDWETPMPVERN